MSNLTKSEIDIIAKDVLENRYGHGPFRIGNLRNIGYSMEEINIIQERVNEMSLAVLEEREKLFKDSGYDTSKLPDIGESINEFYSLESIQNNTTKFISITDIHGQITLLNTNNISEMSRLEHPAVTKIIMNNNNCYTTHESPESIMERIRFEAEPKADEKEPIVSDWHESEELQDV